MDDGGGGGGGGTVVMLNEVEMIEALIKEVNELEQTSHDLCGNNAMCSSYRCATCARLSHDHPKGDVKGCKKKPLTPDEYIRELRQQRDGLKEHVQLLRKGVQAAVDGNEYESLIKEFKVNTNKMRDEILSLQTANRDQDAHFTITVNELQDEIKTMASEINRERAESTSMRLQLGEIRSLYNHYQSNCKPNDQKC